MGRLFSLARLPIALFQAYALLAISGIWMAGFAWFWTFMVIELPKDLGPYSQMSSLSMFMHRAFPMRETNDVSFEYKFEHVILMACVMVVLMMAWAPTRFEIQQKADKAAGKKGAKAKKHASKSDRS
mmetsp:Transcript_109023/g.307284  ORF Transcript_109023/g.307284 Transcript_109023/m.307284 type:complete len:127 (-) Transcript_109023:144-524(-)